MARQRSEEARVIAYFTDTPIGLAEMMLGIVRDVVRKRLAPLKVEKAKAPKRKVKAIAQSATSFESETMEVVR